MKISLIDNYISEEALFLRHIWASASNVSYRTTNACESFQAKFNTTFYQNHPNLYQFIEVLLQFQSQIYAKIKGASKIKKVSRQTSIARICFKADYAI
jgi:hypothetical protein